MQDAIDMMPGVAIAWAAGMTALYFCRSRLRSDALDDAPRRNAGLQPMDIFVGLLLMIGSAVVLLPLAYRAFGWPLPPEELTPVQAGWMRLAGQLLTQGPVLAYLIFRVSSTQGGIRALGLLPRKPGKELAAGGLSLLAAMPIVMGVNAVFMLLATLMQAEKPDPIAHGMLREMMEVLDPVAITLMVTSALLVAPIMEEIIFRGLVQTALQEATHYRMRWVMIVVSGAIFCAIHAGIVQWQALPGLFALGIILGWLYERHGSLLPGILLHMLFNLANIGLAIAIQKEAAG
ncbi:MAG: CPBP family intramembrane glutamic endopeptidase [Phycisphaeraceae bacterium]